MRDHADIVRSVGASALSRLLEANGHSLNPSTPQRWAERNSIPSEYWATLERNGVATLDELARAAEQRRGAGAATEIIEGVTPLTSHALNTLETGNADDLSASRVAS